MASGTGSLFIDFGAHPGSNEASVAVTGQTGISNTSKASAFVMAGDSSANHTPADHKYLPVFAALTCSTPVSGTGFTIYGTSTQKLTGQWAVRFVWSD